MKTLSNVADEMHRLVDEGAQRDIVLRVLGGLAIDEHCPHSNHSALERDYPDIDFVTDKPSSRSLEDFFAEMGYTPNKTLNTLSGDWRRLYYDEARDSRQVDVFIDDFDMNHTIPLAGRLHVEPVTIPLAELFLTKAQIIELNPKDAKDLYALLLDHDVGNVDDETINLDVISTLCGSDWGLYTTISMNIDRLHDLLEQSKMSDGLKADQKHTVRERTRAIRTAIDEIPKTLGWKLRDIVGKRVRWYQEVEEVRR